MHLRNQRMINMALKGGPEHALILALWDGSTGGTKNCLDYALEQKVQAINAWTDFQTYQQK